MTTSTPPPLLQPGSASKATPPVGPARSTSLFERLGEFCARRGWFVVAAWVLILVGTTFASTALAGTYNANFTLPGSSAQIGEDLLQAHPLTRTTVDPNAPASQIVFDVKRGSLVADRTAIEASIQRLRTTPGVATVSDPFDVFSPNHRVAASNVTYDRSVVKLRAASVTATDTAMRAARHDGVAVSYGGDLANAATPPANSNAELIGIGIAVLILLLAFGSVLATVIPVFAAVVGVFAGVGTLGMLSAWIKFPGESPTIALMMGLGVGIDYALFLSTRFRQRVLDGTDPVKAVGQTVASSGRAIVIAAGTVVISLVGLYASGIFYVGQLGVSASITVAVTAFAAITLVPALLGIAGAHIDSIKIRRRPVAEQTGAEGGWNRYARMLAHHPVAYLVSGLLLLAVLAVPALSLRIGEPAEHALPIHATQRLASEAVDSGFGAGFRGKLTLVLQPAASTSTTQQAATATTVRTALQQAHGVVSVSAFTPTPDKAILVGTVIPTTGPNDPATSDLIQRLESSVLPNALERSGAHVYVTGAAAGAIALQNAIASSLPIVLLVVVAAAVLLILLTFRSPLLALKAGVVNLLSIGASYGVLVAVFQWGWGSQLLGIPQGVLIVSYVPLLMFAIIFGLSMDYEVFLLSRIREARMHGQSNADSIAHGLTVTGRIISSAALIMACVFFSFVIQPDAMIKMLAVGLGASVLIDATIVRLVIVPCAMHLFGRANWWTPRWLDRVLPHLEP
jgi:RND superfamily putative drug exporter